MHFSHLDLQHGLRTQTNINHFLRPRDESLIVYGSPRARKNVYENKVHLHP